MASFLKEITDLDTLDRAVTVFAGHLETVLVTNTNASAGPTVKRVSTPRLGGPWLALLRAGYKLTLNTPAEVDSALALAR